MTKLLDGEIARLYAQALVAVARADDEIDREEGLHLAQQSAMSVHLAPWLASYR